MSIKPVFLVTYEGRDVSDELAPMIVSVEYTDQLKGQSDELAMTLEDRAGRWRAGWYPSQGDRIELRVGYEGQPLLKCGTFRVDEVELSGPPDTVSIRALAAAVAKPVRTAAYRAFEGLTLRELVGRLASELELELVGDVAEVKLARVTQGETTLAFLRRLAEEYGYAFSVRETQLVFFALDTLEATKSVSALRRTDLTDYRFKGATQGTYSACVFSYVDPATKKLTSVRVEAEQARRRIIIGGAAPVIPTRTLKVGVTGDDVASWQDFLRGQGNDPGPIDGIFGPRTRAATIAFQRANGASADGVVGPETMRIGVEHGFGTTTSSTRQETAGNVLRIQDRAESEQQAELKARAALAKANRLKVTGGVKVWGNTRLVAGASFDLADMARLSGKYTIDKSTHRMDRSGGYSTQLEVHSV